jgi:hypothetical protein
VFDGADLAELVGPFQGKDHESLDLDRSHPLARDLVAYVVFAGAYGLGYDLVQRAVFTTLGGSPTRNTTRDGSAIDLSGTAHISAADRPAWNVTGDVTVAWRGIIRSTAAAGNLVCKMPFVGNGATNTAFSLEYTNPTANRLSFARSNTNYRVWQSGSDLVRAGSLQTFGVSQPSEISTAPTFYADGVPDSVAAANQYGGAGSGAATSVDYDLIIGRRPDGAEQLNGLAMVVAVAARQWTRGEHAAFARDPYGLIWVPDRRLLVQVRTPTGGASYSLTLAASSFTLTGQALALERGRKLALAAGSFALTGQAVALERGRPLVLAAGSFALSGQAIALRAQRRLALAAGSVALTGQALSLEYGRRLVLASGSFTASGQALGLRAQRRLVLAAGSFALTGQAVDVIGPSARLSLAAGSFAVSGQALSLRAQRRLALAAGSFALTGQVIDLVGTAARLPLAAGSFALSGQAVRLLAQRRLALAVGACSLTGQAVALRRGRSFLLAAGSLAFTGRAITLRRGYRVALEAGAVALSGQALALTYSGATVYPGSTARTVTLPARSRLAVLTTRGRTVALPARRRTVTLPPER